MTGGWRPSVMRTDATSSNSWKTGTGEARPLSRVSFRWITGIRLSGIPHWLTRFLTGCSITHISLASEGIRCANGTLACKTTRPQPNPINSGVAALRWRTDGVQLSSGLRGRLPSDELAALHRIGWQESPEYASTSNSAIQETPVDSITTVSI